LKRGWLAEAERRKVEGCRPAPEDNI
jgi:hypothetical protein